MRVYEAERKIKNNDKEITLTLKDCDNLWDKLKTLLMNDLLFKAELKQEIKMFKHSHEHKEVKVIPEGERVAVEKIDNN